MTDLSIRPALTVPANAYDPDWDAFQDRAHEAIREDLSTVGEVYKITGMIVATSRGVQCDDVKAFVHNRAFTIPIIMDVLWDDETRKLRYFSESQNIFTREQDEFFPVRESYAGDVLNPAEQETLDAVMHQLRTHPAVNWRNKLGSGDLPAGDNTKMIGTLSTVTGSVATSIPVALGTFDPLALLTIPALAAGSALFHRVHTAPRRSAYREHREAATWWNANQDQLLREFTKNTGGISVLLDAVMKKCDQFGLEYVGSIEVPEVPYMSKKSSEKTFYPDGRTDGAIVNNGVLHLQAHYEPYTMPVWLSFDGTHFYHSKEGRTNLHRNTTIVPATHKPTPVHERRSLIPVPIIERQKNTALRDTYRDLLKWTRR